MIFGLISSLFVLSSILYFLLPQLNRFNFQAPAVNATAMGLSSMNIFLIFFSIFLCFAILTRQFNRASLVFILSKPLRASQLLLGSSLGLMFVLFLYWLFISLEVLVIISVFDKSYLLRALTAVLPAAFLIPLYASLCVFFFSIWPSFFSAAFVFIFIFTSFARVDIIMLVSHANLPWLEKLIETSFFFIPPVSQIMAISLEAIGLINVRIDIPGVFLRSIFIICILHILAARRISRDSLDL